MLDNREETTMDNGGSETDSSDEAGYSEATTRSRGRVSTRSKGQGSNRYRGGVRGRVRGRGSNRVGGKNKTTNDIVESDKRIGM